MKVHEFQAKGLLARFGVAVPRGEMVRTPDEAAAATRRLGGRVVVKAQIHAGGRGKGIAHDAASGAPVVLTGETRPLGGVRVASDADQARLKKMEELYPDEIYKGTSGLPASARRSRTSTDYEVNMMQIREVLRIAWWRRD